MTKACSSKPSLSLENGHYYYFEAKVQINNVKIVLMKRLTKICHG